MKIHLNKTLLPPSSLTISLTKRQKMLDMKNIPSLKYAYDSNNDPSSIQNEKNQLFLPLVF